MIYDTSLTTAFAAAVSTVTAALDTRLNGRSYTNR